ncbi:putative glycoside hydrolase [Alteribacter natronophilus]|uniref:putative glycoside hydrolase n=1 Tax=Alteribacter natronophilus TaxID=2583810 RepID=UPI001486997F|nr:putative glycoside hydrolase [Alteribacter natronophilus]
MGKKFRFTVGAIAAGFAVWLSGTNAGYAEENETVVMGEHGTKETALEVREWPERVARFGFDSGYTFEYPDAVRGIFVTAHSAGGSRMDTLIDLMDNTDLNSMVIDVKDDDGWLTYKPDEGSPYEDISKNFISNPEAMMERLEEHEVYPIARVVVFKDTVLAEKKPEWSFTNDDGSVWKNRRGEAFVNPFLKEVWDYNVDIAIKAAEMGFQEIQFDYVRYPEGFERRDEDLNYDVGEYKDSEGDNVQRRVDAVTDFVEYANERLQPYDVDVSVDIFGYTATLPEAPGIGQNFTRISEHVDVISSMIYPSHWTAHFGLDKPDLYPYELVTEYIKLENDKLAELDEPPVSRPWLQDFTASYLGAGNYIPYGVDEVEAQIRALYENGVDEFLLWNAGNRYTKGVDYLVGKED